MTESEKSTNINFRPYVLIGIAVLIIGVLFKIMHWPYAAILILGGFSIIAFFSFLIFFIKKEKQLLDYLKIGMIISFCGRGLIVLNRWPYAAIWTAVFLAFAVAWVIIKFTDSYSHEEIEDNTVVSHWKIYLKNGLLIIGALAVAIGLFLKTIHFPYAGPFLIVGITTAAFWGGMELLILPNDQSGDGLAILKSFLIVIALIGVLIGSLFQIMHWPGASPLLITGMSAGVAWGIWELLFKKD